jgi:L-seryl-tRNA(Ser) seleniumtransferase
MGDRRRATPRTDQVLRDPGLVAAAQRLGPTIVKRAVTSALDRCRSGEIAPDDVPAVALESLPVTATSLRAVVNATGVIVHTNLGRAPLSPAAVEAIGVAAGATDVELDLTDGRRGRRGRGAIEALAAAVPDAGGVHVVNNGAAALALVTCALATGREIVVSRGEMVEIGDGFRVPELIESVGARLREVGTTNRVRLSDYAAAVHDQTAFVLKVHPSNFRVEGFTDAVPVRELARLGVPVVADIGSGLLSPHPLLPDEPDAASTLRAGATLVTASGDKLLGGPQAGLLLGEAMLVERLRRHPLARALRVDKLTLAALEATLTGPPPPVRSALECSVADLRARAERLRAELDTTTTVEVVASEAAIGGGGAPGVVLDSVALSVSPTLAAPLRAGDVPVVGRVRAGRLLLDLRTVPPGSDALLVEALRRAARSQLDERSSSCT